MNSDYHRNAIRAGFSPKPRFKEIARCHLISQGNSRYNRESPGTHQLIPTLSQGRDTDYLCYGRTRIPTSAGIIPPSPEGLGYLAPTPQSRRFRGTRCGCYFFQSGYILANLKNPSNELSTAICLQIADIFKIPQVFI